MIFNNQGASVLAFLLQLRCIIITLARSGALWFQYFGAHLVRQNVPGGQF